MGVLRMGVNDFNIGARVSREQRVLDRVSQTAKSVVAA